MASLLPSLSSEDEGPQVKDDEDDDSESGDQGIDESFEFGGILGEDGGVFSSVPSSTGWSYQTALNNIEKHDEKSSAAPRLDVAALIAAKRKNIAKESSQQQKKNGSDKKNDDDNPDNEDDDASVNSSNSSDSDDSSDSSSTDGSDHDDGSHHDLEEDILKTRSGKDEDEDANDNDNDDFINEEKESVDEDKEEAIKAAAFYDNETPQNEDNNIQVFSQLAISRPILRGVASMGFVQPTPIQAAVIPLTLAGRDVCASAVTGSGKTAAFLLPILERCLHLSGRHTKALILVPTRELAAQCLGMMTTLAQHTKLQACLICGGTKNLQAQAAELRSRPDVVVATPGRLLDHITNTAGVNLDNIDILVLDEADRLLDLGFQEEVKELIKACPVNRQTLLFSATMNTKVDDLIHLSLKRPVRVRISDNKEAKQSSVEVAPRLEQEFVRVRAGNEGTNREGMLLALLTRTFCKETIVFFDTKAAAHRLMILCGLMGLKCAELHGNLTQKQRLEALEDFRQGEVAILLATDLAARGLDIDRVSTVINFEMPSQLETYIHRTGRTARAGRGGSSCTLIGEGRRHLMKELIREAESKQKRKSKLKTTSSFETGLIRSRSIPSAVVTHFASKIASLEPHVEEIMQAEHVARMDRLALMEANKAQNIIEHDGEINGRPKREWFASNNKKKLTKEAALEKQKMIEAKAGTGTHRMTRKKRRAREAMQALNAAWKTNDDGDGSGGDGDDDGSDGGGGRYDTPARPSPVNIKASARKKKKEDLERVEIAAKKSIREEELERQDRAEAKRTKKRSSDAAGDGSLFDEEKVAYKKSNPRQQKEETAAKSSYEFRGYDPSQRLGKKKTVKGFKSKSKFKRRK